MPPAAAASQGGSIDPATLMRIKNLELRARLVVEGLFHGLHRSPVHGFSVEFSEYRQYTPGDDPRYLDWRLFARSDRYFIKRFEDETNLRCYLVLDQSRSMQFGSLSYTKADYAATLVATLAYFLSQQRDAVGLFTFAQEIGEYLPARYRPGHLHRLMLALERSAPPGTTDLDAALRRTVELCRRRGLVVLISDLLAPCAGLEQSLGMLKSRGHEAILFQLLDPAELELNFREPALFEDVETGRQLYVDPDAIRSDYRRRLAEHLEYVARTCRRLEVEYHQLSTSRPLDGVLFDFLRSRQDRGRQVRRKAARPARRMA